LVKSRGAPRSVIDPAAPRFQKAFADFKDLLRQPGALECVLKERLIPAVPVTESGDTREIDENTLLEAMPDFVPFLPRE
jgi:hypothetical protein